MAGASAPLDGVELTTAISASMVELYGRFYGHDHTTAATYINDNTVVCILEDILASGEDARIAAGAVEQASTDASRFRPTVDTVGCGADGPNPERRLRCVGPAYDRYAKWALRFASRLCHQPDMAEDIVQEAFISI